MSIENFNKQVNPFNFFKLLSHRECIEDMLNNKIVYPITTTIDPSGICNHDCYFCNSKKTHINKFISAEQYKNILNLLCIWNIKSICFAGGGEPCTNSQFGKIVELTADKNVDIGITTNGSLIHKHIQSFHNIKFIGVSIETHKPHIYKKIRKSDDFGVVIKNIENLNKIRISNNIQEVSIKILINEYNYTHLYETCVFFKNIGISHIYIRPLDIYANKSIDLNLYHTEKFKITLKEELKRVMSLNNNNFYVNYLSQLTEEFTLNNYHNCSITPLASSVFCADGNVYICTNHRHDNNFKIASWLNIDELRRKWYGAAHLNKIRKIDTKNCIRCPKTFANIIIDKCVKNDDLYKNFI